MKRKRIIVVLLAVFITLTQIACKKTKKVALFNLGVSEDTEFGAVIVNISIEEFNQTGFNLGDSCNVKFSNGFELNDIPYYNGYYVKNLAPLIVAYPSSTELKIAFNNGTLWKDAKLTTDSTVDIVLNTAKKYLTTQESLGQSYSVERNKYTSDEEFCNFRTLKGGTLKENLIYRGASPVDNSRNRAKYVDSLLEKNNIASIIDLADNIDKMNKYQASDDFASNYTQELYDNGQVILLSMSSSYFSDSYKQSVVKGFRHMLSTSGPYYIHCLEGKDRTGFVCVLIEALASSSYDEMCEDYMLTYDNYFKINKTNATEKYNAIVALYFDAFMEYLYGSSDITTLKTANYVESAKNYLRSGGMTDDEINNFIKLISK